MGSRILRVADYTICSTHDQHTRINVRIEVDSAGIELGRCLEVGGAPVVYDDLAGAGDIGRLPACLDVMLESLLRFADRESVDDEDMAALADWVAQVGRTQRAQHGETISLTNLSSTLMPAATLDATLTRAGGSCQNLSLPCRVDTALELDYIRHGGDSTTCCEAWPPRAER